MKVMSAWAADTINFRFAGDIIVNAEEEEADAQVDRLDTTTTRYKMEHWS